VDSSCKGTEATTVVRVQLLLTNKQEYGWLSVELNILTSTSESQGSSNDRRRDANYGFSDVLLHVILKIVYAFALP
jgi:hypothetical protein